MINSYDKDTIITELISKAKGDNNNPFSFAKIEELPVSGSKICKISLGEGGFKINALMSKTAKDNSFVGNKAIVFNLSGVYCVLDVLY